jgi:hypothetical protein
MAKKKTARKKKVTPKKKVVRKKKSTPKKKPTKKVAPAAVAAAPKRIGCPLVKLRAGAYNAGGGVFARPAAALRMARAASAPAVTAKFNVTYHGFSAAAKTAFQAAVDVWSVLLSSSVTIRVEAHWTALGFGVLGSAGPVNIERDFSAAPQPNTWYPIALANKLAGADLTPGSAHIIANFNSTFSNWYFGIDGATPLNKYDLMSVVLHELGHGLGFIGSMDASSGLGTWGFGTRFPIIYDQFTENLRGERLLDLFPSPTPSTALAGELTSAQLFFDGSAVRAANGGAPARIYAPIVWDEGSSYSHLNEDTFPAPFDINRLMTPQIGMNEPIHDPGPIGLGLLQDLGW